MCDMIMSYDNEINTKKKFFLIHCNSYNFNATNIKGISKNGKVQGKE